MGWRSPDFLQMLQSLEVIFFFQVARHAIFRENVDHVAQGPSRKLRSFSEGDVVRQLCMVINLLVLPSDGRTVIAAC